MAKERQSGTKIGYDTPLLEQMLFRKHLSIYDIEYKLLAYGNSPILLNYNTKTS